GSCLDSGRVARCVGGASRRPRHHRGRPRRGAPGRDQSLFPRPGRAPGRARHARTLDHLLNTGGRMNRARGAAPWLIVGALTVALGAAGALLKLSGSRPAAGAIRLDDVTTHGEWVWIRRSDGDSLRAYVAYPERSDTAPAVIVIHEIYGLTDWEPTVADRLAAAGYVAIVPD